MRVTNRPSTFVYLHICESALAPPALSHSVLQDIFDTRLRSSAIYLMLLLGTPVPNILCVIILFGSLSLSIFLSFFFLVPLNFLTCFFLFPVHPGLPASPVSAWVQEIPMPGNVLVG